MKDVSWRPPRVGAGPGPDSDALGFENSIEDVGRVRLPPVSKEKFAVNRDCCSSSEDELKLRNELSSGLIGIE